MAYSFTKQIKRAVNPFKLTCNLRRIKIDFLEPDGFHDGGKAAWDTLNLIFFNLVQNAVKYND